MGWLRSASLEGMWPPADSTVPYDLAGECPSCGRDLNGALPRMPIADPSALLDVELVALWRFWTQTHYFASSLDPEESLLAEFRQWLSAGTIEHPEPPKLSATEGEFVRVFRAGLAEA